jgi:hypothetical protein
MTAATAREVLASYKSDSITVMARERGVDVRGKGGKDGLIELLARTLYEPARVEAAIANLAPNERYLLDELVLSGGNLPTSVAKQRLLDENLIVESAKATWSSPATALGAPNVRGSKQFADVVARLGALGLAFTTAPTGGNPNALADLHVPGSRLYVPDAILPLLAKPALPVETTAAPAPIQPADPAAFLRDLFVLLSAVDREPIPLVAKGLVGKRHFVRLLEGFRAREDASRVRSEDELPRFSLLRALGEDLGALAVRSGNLVLGEGAEAFLERPISERRAALVTAYRSTRRWNEIGRLSAHLSVKGASPREAPGAIIRARQRVLDELSQVVPTGAWVSRDHLRHRLKRTAYELLFTRLDASAYTGYYGYVPSPYGGANELGWVFNGVRQDESAWDEVEGGLIDAVIAALGFLGVVDLGGPASAPTAFRVTADGAALLRGTPLPSEPAAPNVIVQPNYQIFAFEPTPDDVLFTLERVAERVKADQAIEYRLTRESFYRALHAAELTAEDILAFLQRVSSVPVPQNVAKTLEEWGAQLDRIVIRQGTPLLQAASAAALDALYADPELRRLLGRRLAPTAALVAPGHLRELHRQLLGRGRLPARTEGAIPAIEPAYQIDAHGTIHLLQRLPSLIALRHLRPIAEAGDDGQLRLTPASLRQGARATGDHDELIAAIQRFHAGPLLPDVKTLIQTWAKDWGTGRLASVVLLQVDTPEILTSLLADPELHGLVRQLSPSATTAIVRPDAVEQVRALLLARGMQLRDTV